MTRRPIGKVNKVEVYSSNTPPKRPYGGKGGNVDKKELANGIHDTKSLEENGIYFFNTDVDGNSVGEAIRFILESNLNRNCNWDYITFIINSPGGYVTDGFALIDVMHGSRIPIHTVGIGMIASMGLQLFLAGEKGHRILTPNTMILSHQFAGGNFGKEHELLSARHHDDMLSQNIMRHYRRTTGLTDDEIREYLLPPSDIWLTAQEAKKLGICDVVKDVMPRGTIETKTTKAKPVKKPATKGTTNKTK